VIHAKNPVNDLGFWQERIYRAFAQGGMLHQVILNDSYDLWCWIQSAYAKLVKEHIPPGAMVLDAGCGYGALLSCFDEAALPVRYVGVDFSPDLIRLAKLRYIEQDITPAVHRREFAVARLESLPYPDKHFHWTVVRSVDGMIKESLSPEAWEPMHKELRRVSQRILLGGYPTQVGDPIPYEIEA